MEKIRILITEDHTLIRETWKQVLNNDPRFEVVAECGSGEEAIEKVKELHPDIVIMDINLPDMSGIEATKMISKLSPGSNILGVSHHSQPVFAQKMMQAGASGYVTKNSHHEEMFTAISEIAEGRKYICTEIKNILSDHLLNGEESRKGVNSLSGREIEVIQHIRNGESSKEIAVALNIAVKTVEVHRYHILKKLELKNSTSLINFINNHPEFQIDFNRNDLISV